jgi:hypothetical protein
MRSWALSALTQTVSHRRQSRAACLSCGRRGRSAVPAHRAGNPAIPASGCTASACMRHNAAAAPPEAAAAASEGCQGAAAPPTTWWRSLERTTACPRWWSASSPWRHQSKTSADVAPSPEMHRSPAATTAAGRADSIRRSRPAAASAACTGPADHNSLGPCTACVSLLLRCPGGWREAHRDGVRAAGAVAGRRAARGILDRVSHAVVCRGAAVCLLPRGGVRALAP